MQFAKYNASGNDFVIFHTFHKSDRSALAKAVCHRQQGIGADGLIVLVPHETHDFEWQFYNSDGSVASMCGNGSRACAHYAFKNGLASSTMAFLTGAGVVHSLVEKDVVETELTRPKQLAEAFEENGFLWHFYDTGVPHLVTFVSDVALFDKTIARQMRYKYNANVNFVALSNKSLHVRTYERGVEDETLACGTGMAASFYGAWLQKKVDESALVYPTSQEELTLRIEEGKIFFKGAVQHVFDASWEYISS